MNGRRRVDTSSPVARKAASRSPRCPGLGRIVEAQCSVFSEPGNTGRSRGPGRTRDHVVEALVQELGDRLAARAQRRSRARPARMATDGPAHLRPGGETRSPHHHTRAAALGDLAPGCCGGTNSTRIGRPSSCASSGAAGGRDRHLEIRQLTLEPIQVRPWRAIAPRCAASRGARSRRSRRARGTAARAARVLRPRPSRRSETDTAGARGRRRRTRDSRWVAAAVGQQPACSYQRTAEAATPPFAPAPRSSRASPCDDRRPPRSGAAGRAASATAPGRFADGVGWRVA